MIFFVMQLALGMRLIGNGHPHALIGVRGCKNEVAPIYEDRKLTRPMPNPFVADADGHFDFYVTTKCAALEEWTTGRN